MPTGLGKEAHKKLSSSLRHCFCAAQMGGTICSSSHGSGLVCRSDAWREKREAEGCFRLETSCHQEKYGARVQVAIITSLLHHGLGM